MDKSVKVILLEPGRKILWILTSGYLFSQGFIRLMNNEGNMRLGIIWLTIAIFQVSYFALSFSRKSKFSPKVKVDSAVIELKKSFWKRSELIKWEDVNFIQLSSYQVGFYLTYGTKIFSYKTNPKSSVQLKRTLREFAEAMQIQVIGG